MPLTSSVRAGEQTHSPLPFDPEKERIIWESRQGNAHLPKLLASVDLGDEGIVFSNPF